MDLSPFVSPEPATRRDGWSPERKLRFLDRLAACGNVRAACASVGLSRDSAYNLRRGDALFARGWAAALVLAREASVEVLADRAIDGLEEDIWYRGELVGTRRKYDSRLLLAHLARLDKLVEEAAGGAAKDAERFEELLGCIAGAEAPEEFQVADDPLPLDREAALSRAAAIAGKVLDDGWQDRVDETRYGELDDEQQAAYEAELEAETAKAHAEAGARWDGWFERATRAVDRELGGEADAPGAGAPDDSPGTVSDVSGSLAGARFVGPDGGRYARG